MYCLLRIKKIKKRKIVIKKKRDPWQNSIIKKNLIKDYSTEKFENKDR
jgi:hypothetical protein